MPKWFRVSTEGATTDGRNISRKWIEQMAKNFDRSKYGARIWMEHLRGLFHDGPFAALGDVTALKAEEIKEGDLKGKLALYAQLDPTPALKEINEHRQKIYSSIEVDPDFADTGEAYLIGLAVTDSPASLGTEMLQFSAQQGANSPLAGRKKRPENLFTVAEPIDLTSLFATGDDPDESKPGLLEQVKQLFAKHTQIKFSAEFRQELNDTLELFVTRISALEASLQDQPTAEQFSSVQASLTKLQADFTALYTKLDFTPDTDPRPGATGGDGMVLTDC